MNVRFEDLKISQGLMEGVSHLFKRGGQVGIDLQGLVGRVFFRDIGNRGSKLFGVKTLPVLDSFDTTIEEGLSVCLRLGLNVLSDVWENDE
jgi:hypothetical protein